MKVHALYKHWVSNRVKSISDQYIFPNKRKCGDQWMMVVRCWLGLKTCRLYCIVWDLLSVSGTNTIYLGNFAPDLLVQDKYLLKIIISNQQQYCNPKVVAGHISNRNRLDWYCDIYAKLGKDDLFTKSMDG